VRFYSWPTAFRRSATPEEFVSSPEEWYQRIGETAPSNVHLLVELCVARVWSYVGQTPKNGDAILFVRTPLGLSPPRRDFSPPRRRYTRLLARLQAFRSTVSSGHLRPVVGVLRLYVPKVK